MSRIVPHVVIGVCRRCGEDRLSGVRYTEPCLMARDGVSGHSWTPVDGPATREGYA